MGVFGFANEERFDGLIWAAAARTGVDPLIIKATIAKESGFNPDAYRPEPGIGDASRGLMQVLYKTAVWLGYRGEPDGLFDPTTSIDLGARYLAYQRGRYPTGPEGDLYAAYNAGSVKYAANGAYINQAVVTKWAEYLAGYRAHYGSAPITTPAPAPEALPLPDTSSAFWDALQSYPRSDPAALPLPDAPDAFAPAHTDAFGTPPDWLWGLIAAAVAGVVLLRFVR